MTEQVKNSMNIPNKRSSKPLKIILICLLVAAVAVAAFLIIDNIIKNAPDRAAKGVTVSGIDIAAMTKDEALAATSTVPTDLLANSVVSVSFDGTISNFSAQDLGLTTDYDAVMAQAMAYGHDGSGSSASKSSPNFTVHIKADKVKIASVLTPIAQKYNKQPVDPSAQFMPWGYLNDGTAYKPDQQAILKACADEVAYSEPAQLVRLTADQMPNKLRYEYWNNTKYVANYIPPYANISRFLYKDGVNGQSVNVDALVNSVVDQVQNGDKATISAPLEAIEPSVKLADIKSNTQLIASWTSSFSNHLSYNRNWNVAKLSGIINSVVIQPGQTWSINKQAGERTVANGWLEAPGIELGGFTQQPGGGVCQISSTLYNAAIRSNLDIVDSSHHSISSDYIPLGLDATISSNSPDLKLKDPNTSPIYIVSYVDPKAHTVTVEIYGQPVNDPKYGDVILDYSFVDGGSVGAAPGMSMVYNTAAAPDGTQIAPGQSYVYAIARPGRAVQTYKYFISPDGKELGSVPFTNYTWNPTNGTTYVNGPPPAVPPAPPPAAPAASPTVPASPTEAPTAPPPPLVS